MSYDFTGASGGELDFGTSPSTLDPTQPNSFSTWVQYDTAVSMAVLAVASGAATNGALLYLNSDSRRLYLYWLGTSSFRQRVSWTNQIPVAAANNWVHIAATMDGSTTADNWNLYVDGSEVSSYGSSEGSASTLVSADDDYILGNSGPRSTPFNGRIAFSSVWSNYELTAADVATLYRAHPYTVRPGKIVFAPELTVGAVDSISQATGTPTNATLDADNPPIVYPVGPIYIPSAAAAPPAGPSIPIAAYHHFHHNMSQT